MSVYTSGGVLLTEWFIKKEGFLSEQEAMIRALKTRGAEFATPLLASYFCHSEPVFSINKNNKTNIEILKQNGFKVELHLGKEDVTTVSYKSKDKEYRLPLGEKIELILTTFEFADYSDGIPFLPTIYGTLKPKNYIQPGTLAFCAAFADSKDAPPLLKEIASTQDGTILVKWSEMGLSGTKRLKDLWEEISLRYPSRKNLPRTGIIKPNPYLPTLEDFRAMSLVTKEQQTVILAEWEKQIIEFEKDSSSVP